MPTPQEVRQALIQTGTMAEDPHGFLIDLNRPLVVDKEGVHTELTRTVEFDTDDGSVYFNIPTIWGGKRLPEEKAVEEALNYMKQGGELPKFKDLSEAEKAAKARSEAIGELRAEEIKKAEQEFKKKYGKEKRN